jgi:hypothetical protein
MIPRTVWPEPLPEESSIELVLDGLEDQDGQPLDPSLITAVTLTLYDRVSGAVINGWQDRTILNANGGALSLEGRLSVHLGPPDMRILDDTRASEDRVALIHYEWNSGQDARNHEIHFALLNLSYIPA